MRRRREQPLDLAVLAPVANAHRQEPRDGDRQDHAGRLRDDCADPHGHDHRERREVHAAADEPRIDDVVLDDPQQREKGDDADDVLALAKSR